MFTRHRLAVILLRYDFQMSIRLDKYRHVAMSKVRAFYRFRVLHFPPILLLLLAFPLYLRNFKIDKS